jgi:hypothetical protein
MKFAVFWDIAPCSLVKFTDVSDVFTAFVSHLIMMEAVNTSDVPVNVCQAARRSIQQDWNLHTRRGEKKQFRQNRVM